MTEHHGPIVAQQLSGYLETHAGGGTDAVVAASVFVLGGAGTAWYLVRRARRRDEAAPSASTAADSPQVQDGPTRIPARLVDRLPELLDATVGDPDTDAPAQEARALIAADEAYAVLAERVRARLGTPGSVAEAAARPPAPPPPARDRVDATVPPVEAAALVVLEAQLRARARALAVQRAGADPTAVPVPRFCSFNPFHGQTTVTAQPATASAAVPVCAACRDALAAGEDPDELRVRTRTGVRSLAEADGAYARGFAGTGEELLDAVREPPDSGPAGARREARDAAGGVLTAIAVPVLVLVLAAVVGMVVSILLADGTVAAEEAGPTVLGYPLLNGLRGAAIGALGGLVVFGIAAAALIGLRRRRTGAGSASVRDGYDPHRRSELEQTAVEENIRRLRER
jgi:hypothetical protein